MTASKVKSAMVLAAGLGTRMRPLTLTRPKCLVTVGGKALIDHMLDRLAAAGIERVVVNVHAFADMLEAHVKLRRDLEIIVSDERELLLETGGGVRKALPLLGEAPFVVANTDSIWDEYAGSSLASLIAGFDETRMDARLMLARMDDALGFEGAGDFVMDGVGRLERRGDRDSAPFAYTGVQVVRPEAVASEPVEPFSFTRIWRRIEAEGRLHGGLLDGFWMHVGDPGARDEAEARVRSRSL
jgi:N-acetyl-alpha-D-muramate 1-phosphate uridylyltransferase